MSKQIGKWLVGLLLGVLPLVARGAVAVGDKPEWSAVTMDGGQTGSAALDGKMVLIDFWATWCGPCMGEVPHMIKVNEQYGPQGLVIVGISLDRNAGAWQQTIQAKGMKWLHSMDAQNRQPLSGMFGVNGIPHTFLINPAGEVIWAGHPAGMDGPLADAFKRFTVRMVDKKTLADATAALDKAEAAVKSNDMAVAARAMAKIPPAAVKEKALAPRVEQVQKDLTAYASGILAEADDLLGKKEYVAAITKLQLLTGLSGLPDSRKAAEKLAAIKAMPETKAAFEAAAKAEQDRAITARSEELLAAARKLKADKKDEQAYLAFKNVARQFASIPAGVVAAEEAAAYEKDPAFVKKVTTGVGDAKARAMLNLANSYKTAGRMDLAKSKYQAVIDQFAGTPSADEAKKALETLPKD